MKESEKKKNEEEADFNNAAAFTAIAELNWTEMAVPRMDVAKCRLKPNNVNNDERQTIKIKM